MTKQELIETLADAFNIEPDDETGEYDLNDYDWQAGCYCNHVWFSLASVVDALVPLCDDGDEW